MEELDAIDLQILELLQRDGRMPNSDLAQQVGLTPPTVLRRVKLMEERGYIRGYAAQVDPIRLGLTVTSFIFVETSAGCSLIETEEFLAGLPGVQEVHRTIGEWCFIVKVRTATPQTLEQLIYVHLRNHPSVRRTFTHLITSSPFETTALPLPAAAERAL